MTDRHFILHGVASSATSAELAGRELVIEGDLAAVVTAVDAEASSDLFMDETRAQGLALSHHELLTQLMEVIDIIPVRIGSVYSSEAAVRETLKEATSFFTEQLSALGGRAEYVLSVSRSEVAKSERDEAPSTGRSYLASRGAKMRARRAARGTSDAFIDDLAGEILALTPSVKSENPRKDNPSEIARLVFLEGKRMTASALERLEAIQTKAQTAGFELSVTGPWPPYSFAGEAA